MIGGEILAPDSQGWPIPVDWTSIFFLVKSSYLYVENLNPNLCFFNPEVIDDLQVKHTFHHLNSHFFPIFFGESRDPLKRLNVCQITCVNTMAAGLKYCDRALTVSPSYAVECTMDPEKGASVMSQIPIGLWYIMG